MNKNLIADIPVTACGQRVDVTLAQLFPQFSRSQLTTWLKQGVITIDEKSLKPKEKILGGECVVLKLNTIELADENKPHKAQIIPLDIIFEDDSLIVINKPAGLIVHPGAGNPDSTLVNALLHHEPNLRQLPRAGIIHRLDKDTTGLLVIAKNLTAHTNLVRQMQERSIDRHYIALVHGNIIAGSTIETFYGRHPKQRIKMAVTNSGKEAITQYRVRKHYNTFTLLDLKLMTGRTHQIRVHMAHIKHPVVGDSLYGRRAHIPAGASEQLQNELRLFKRQTLHAAELSFTHPETQEVLTFNAPLPDDFNSLLLLLDEYVLSLSS